MKPINTTNRVIITGVAAALLAGGAFAGYLARRVDAAPVHEPESLTVTVAEAMMTDLATAIETGGVVQARTTATITARIVAPVREVRVSPGDRVRAGQTLVVLEGNDLAAAARAARSAAMAAEQGANAAAAELRAAEAGLVLARASHDRIVGLQARGSATAQELDEATAALRSADARVGGASARTMQAASALESATAVSDQLRTTESFTTITAPFDGIVTAKMVEPGNMASPGVPLLRVEDIGAFRLEVRVDESRIGELRNGDSVPVLLGRATTALPGTIVEVSRAVDADARAFLVKIALPETPGVRSGEFGRARFAGPPRRALTVPASAMVHRGQLTTVFVVANGVARVRLVNVSESEVLAGLSESEMVVVAPPTGLSDGHHVRVGGR